MIKTIKLVILIIISLSVYFIYQNTKNTNIKILNLGDKLSQGFNSSGVKGYGFINYYQEYLYASTRKVDVNNEYSKKYLTINELLLQIKEKPRLKRELAESDIIFLTIGYNDLVYKINLEETTNRKNINILFTQTIKEYNKLIKEIRKYYKEEIICVGYYKPNNKDYNLDLGIKRLNFFLETQKEITYINTYKLLADKKKYFSNPNSYYPNELGYKKIFQEIIKQTKKTWKVKKNLIY